MGNSLLAASLGLVSEDFELLHRWRDGNTEAGSELFARHFDRLVRFFANKVDEPEYEDLIQRTLLSCVESRDRFREESSFRTYLFAVARNEMLMHFRRKRSRPELDFSQTTLEALRTSPSEHAIRGQEKALLLDALQRLPVDAQLLVELHYWEGLDPGELAAIFGIDRTTVRTRLHRTRSRLREIIEELGDDPTARAEALGGLDTWAREVRAEADDGA